MIDTRLMDLSGTRAGEIVLFARVSQVMASPDGVHDLQAAFMRGRQRRAVRLHKSTSRGESFYSVEDAEA